jgi:hypothetical protein
MNSIRIKNYDLRWHTVFILLGCVFFPVRAHAGFAICNDLKDQFINAVVGYSENVDFGGGAVFPETYIEGWYPVKPGRCTIVFMFITERIYYVFAQDQNEDRKWPYSLRQTWRPIDAADIDMRPAPVMKTFCTLPHKFRIPIEFAADEANCRGVLEDFEIVDVGERTVNFTYRITANGKVLLEKGAPLPPPPKPPLIANNGFRTYPNDGSTLLQGASNPLERWQQDIEWCKRNSDGGGSVDCPDEYLSRYPMCLRDGAGRACLMGKAMDSAKAGDCDNAFRLALVCQCHNKVEQGLISNAGETAVCKYLGPPPPVQIQVAPAQPPPPPLPAPPNTGAVRPVTFINQSGMTLYLYYFTVRGGTVDCKDYAFGGTLSPGGASDFQILGGSTMVFVFQKGQDPCPLSTIRFQTSLSGGNPNHLNVNVP